MAQTLKFGNGTWATKKGSTLAYSDTNNAFKPLPFTYTGAGKGTRVNKEGLIEVVENDRPRIDYTDSEDGVFLLEKAATNYIINSQSISLSPIKNGTFTDNFAISPDGTLNATKLTATDIDPYFYQSVSFAASTYTASIYVKGIGNSIGKEFRFSIGGSSSNPKLKIPSEWTRFEYTVSMASGSANTGLEITDPAVVGDEVLVWGWQVENNSHATSYIPTQGNPQTRVQETASGSGNSEVFSDSQGVFYIDTAALSNDGTNRQISISDGNTSQRVYFGFRSNSNEFLLSSRDSSYIVTTIGDVTNFNKYAFQYKSGNFKAFINGFNYTLDADGGLLPTGLNTLNFNDGAGGADYYGKTKEIGYYDTVLTDLELETLTSYRSWEAMVKELNLNIIHNE